MNLGELRLKKSKFAPVLLYRRYVREWVYKANIFCMADFLKKKKKSQAFPMDVSVNWDQSNDNTAMRHKKF